MKNTASGRVIPGTYSIQLLEDFNVAIEDYVFCVPYLFVSDGASIPIGLRNLFSRFGKHSDAAILHDWLYHTGELPRKEADRIFRAHMKLLGVKWRAYAMWAGVAMFGGWSWRSHRKGKQNEA